MDICLSARDFPAHEALANGLVSRSIPGDKEKLLREALNYAGNISKLSPIAIIGTKRALVYNRDHGVPSGLNQIGEWNMCMLQTGDIPKALQAQATKAEANFSKL